MSQALFILMSGVLLATQENDGTETEVVRLGPSDCFGDAGVLTASPTPFTVKAPTRASVYEIANDDLVPILKERPGVAAELTQVLARRKAVGQERLERLDERKQRDDNRADRLRERIKELFKLR